MGDRLALSPFALFTGIGRKATMQAFPIEYQFSAGAFVLLGPIHQQVQASMVDVAQDARNRHAIRQIQEPLRVFAPRWQTQETSPHHACAIGKRCLHFPIPIPDERTGTATWLPTAKFRRATPTSRSSHTITITVIAKIATSLRLVFQSS